MLLTGVAAHGIHVLAAWVLVRRAVGHRHQGSGGAVAALALAGLLPVLGWLARHARHHAVGGWWGRR